MNDLYKRVPREFKKNLRWRRFLLAKAKGNPKVQQAIREYCAKDPVFWINSFIYQTNPDVPDSAGPFICWPHQERAILSQDPDKPGLLWCIKNGRSVVIEKSRKQGATWLVLIVKDWLCRFTPYYDSLMMSKSAVAVDSASRQSLFGKLRFIHEHLPRWLHNEDTFLDNKNSFGYAESHSTMTGFSSTGKAGVSERGADFMIDEYAQIEEDYEVLYRTQATARCRIFISTHMGMGTAFYTLTQSQHFKKIVLHWTQHPAMNKGLYRWNELDHKLEFLKYNEETDDLEVVPFPHEYLFPGDYEFDKTGEPVGGPHPGVRSPEYDRAFQEMAENKAEMAKDWDINPTGSVSQFYNPLVIKQLIDEGCKPPLMECELEYDKETGEPVKLVPTHGGRIKLWCNLDAQGRPAKAFYGAGADISQGTGCTPSCFSIWCAQNGTKVLEYQDANIRPYEFAVLCVALCRLFKGHDNDGAKLAWENQGPGAMYGKTVWDTLKYMAVYCATSDIEFRHRVSDKPGWNPTKVTKLGLHGKYRQALYERKARNRSRAALDETLNFKHDGQGSVEHTQYKSKDDPAGGRENHGDIVVADALGYKMIEEYGNTEELQEDNVVRPGTLAHLWALEAQAKGKKDELYPNWRGR